MINFVILHTRHTKYSGSKLKVIMVAVADRGGVPSDGIPARSTLREVDVDDETIVAVHVGSLS